MTNKKIIIIKEKDVNTATKYTQEQLDIAILKNTQEGMLGSIYRVEQRMESTIARLEQKIDSNFHWTLGLMFGIYAMGLGTLLSLVGKYYGWF